MCGCGGARVVDSSKVVKKCKYCNHPHSAGNTCNTFIEHLASYCTCKKGV